MVMNELQICLTNKCYVNCRHCHIDKEKDIEISYDIIKKAVNLAKENSITHIRLTGGDVFEHKELRLFLEYIQSNNLKVILNISYQRLDELASIDGLYDILLLSFQDISQIIAAKKRLKSIVPGLMGCIVFNSSWLFHLKELSAVVSDIGFDHFFFLRDVNDDSRQYFKDLNECIERISQLTDRIKFSNAFPLCFVSKENINLCSGNRYDNGFERLYIAPDGSIKPSAYSRIILGTVDDNFNDLWLENIKKVNESFNGITLCKMCKVREYCGGGIIAGSDYAKDPFMKHIFLNKYATKLQQIEKQVLPRTDFRKDMRLIYHVNSSFYMRYPPAEYWRAVDDVDLSSLFTIKGKELNIYIHFPFCWGFCRFCNVKKKSSSEREQYVKRLLDEIDKYKEVISGNRIGAVYFGGGSPQLMGVDNAKIIFTRLFSYFSNKPSEVTFEFFPKNYDDDLMQFLKGYVTRVSIGLQCFDDDALKMLGRLSAKQEMIEFIKRIKMLDFKKVNFDVIYGAYINNKEGFEKDFNEILDFMPDHVTYQPLHFTTQMRFDQGNSLVNAIHLNPIGRKILEERGYRQNSAEDFSKGDKLEYQEVLLRQKNLLGLGDGAFGFIEGFCYKNEAGRYYGHEMKKLDKLYRELFLSSRFLEVDIPKLDRDYDINYKADFSDSLKYLLRIKYIKFEGGKIKITLKGRNYVDLISNTLSLNNLEYKLR